MDFDEEDKPKEVSKPRRFAPSRAGKSKPEQPAEKVELPSQNDAPSESVSKSEHDVDAEFAVPKVEPKLYNGSVKMEIDSKVDKEPETTEAELMEVDKIPLQEEKEEEEEDVVVREIDVYFNPSIDDNAELYVLQYPLRPSWRPYDMDERCKEVRVNPSTSQVEIDFSLDDQSSNFDSEIARELNMTKQTLTTTWKPPPTLDYVVGVLSGDKLHLNPVHAVAQLRPSMQYFSSKNKQAEATEESVGTSKKQKIIEKKGVRESTDQKPIPEENWVSLKYHGLQSDLCSKYLKGMMANENSAIDFNMSLEVYINSMCRGERSRNSESKDSLKRILTSLPLEERVQKLLCQGPLLFRYNVLKHHAPELSDEDFLRVLQQYAWLVQGLWTPKTRLLKLDSPLELSRDYVLMLFNKGSTIKFSDVEATGSLTDKMKTMLTVFAKERPLLRDWKFREPTDVSFIKSYPEIAKEQASFWQAMDVKLTSIITKKGKSIAEHKKNVVVKNPSATAKLEPPTSLSDKGGSSRNTIPCVVRQEDIRGAITKALKKVFDEHHQVCSYETICQRLRDLAVSTSNNPKADSAIRQSAKDVALAVDAHKEELKQAISEVAVDINGSFVSKSSPCHPQLDSLREVVIELLHGVGHGKKLMKAHVFEAGKTRLGRVITNNEYQKVMQEICKTNSSGWVLQKAK